MIYPHQRYVRFWDDRNVIYHEASRKCYQIHNATNSLGGVDTEQCPIGTSFLLCKDKLLRPNEKWTVGNKTKVSDIQVSQGQQEEPVNDVTNTRMTMVSPGPATSRENNPVYMDDLLSILLQKEQSNSLKQRVDALIKKRDLIQNRRLSVNGHYVMNLCKHEHSVQIDSSGYDFDTNRQKHRKCCQTAPLEDHKSEQIQLYHIGNSNPPPVYANSSVSGDSEVSSI